MKPPTDRGRPLPESSLHNISAANSDFCCAWCEEFRRFSAADHLTLAANKLDDILGACYGYNLDDEEFECALDDVLGLVREARDWLEKENDTPKAGAALPDNQNKYSGRQTDASGSEPLLGELQERGVTLGSEPGTSASASDLWERDRTRRRGE